MEQKKLTLEEFNEYKYKLITILSEAENFIEQNKDNKDFDEEKVEMEIEAKYLSIQNELLSYDLSNIPFEAWENIDIVSDYDYVADFSKTHANIDLELLTPYKGRNFTGCNIKNLEKYKNYFGDIDLYDLNQFLYTLGKGNFDKIIERNIEEIKYLFNNDFLINYFCNYYLSAYNNDEQKSEESFEQTFHNILAEFFKSKYSAVTTWKQFMDYDGSYDLSDMDQNQVILSLGINNLKRFEQETGFFSKKIEYNGYAQENFYHFMEFSKHNLQKCDLYSRCKTYEDFQRKIATILIANKEAKEHIEYDWLKEKYKQSYPDLFNSLDEYEKIESFVNEVGFEFVNEFIDRCGKENFYKFHQKYGDLLGLIDLYNLSSLKGTSFDINLLDRKIEKQILSKIIITREKYHPNHSSFAKSHPELFLDDSVPQEIKDKFYTRKLTFSYFKQHPEFIPFFQTIDLNLIADYTLIVKEKENNNGAMSLVDYIIKKFGREQGFKELIYYDPFFTKLKQYDEYDIVFDENATIQEIKNKLDDLVYKAITEKRAFYDDKTLDESFKEKYPQLFLDENTPQEIKNKFYNKKFTLDDFYDLSLLEKMGDANIILGFSTDYKWMNKLFSQEENSQSKNVKRLKVISKFEQINDVRLKKVFKGYLEENSDTFQIGELEDIVNVLKRLEYSNSSELRSFSYSFAEKLLNLEDPMTSLEKIENIFIQNNLPFFAKMFLSFQHVYPDFKKIEGGVNRFDFSDTSRIAPQLKDQSLPNIGYHLTPVEKRFQIVYNDLLRITYRSGSLDLMEYLNQLETGNDLFINYMNNGFKQDNFSEEDKQTFDVFMSHLETMYENLSKEDIHNLPLEEKSKILYKTFEPTSRYDFKDRIVRTFCYSAGITTFNQLKELAISSKKEADERGRKYAEELSNKPFEFEEGDFLRGMGDFQSIGGSLSIGNVCKEQLITINDTSMTDVTPLDIDITRVNDKPLDIYHTVSGTPTSFSFGNVYQIIKKDNPNFVITRDKDGNLTNEPYNPLKAELFGTHIKETGASYETHWGARTAVAMTDIDYILYKQKGMIDASKPYDENGNVNYLSSKDDEMDLDIIKYEIAKNGFYLPVIDFSGKLIYSVEEYENIRNMMQGLSHYGVSEYKLSEHLNLQECPISSELTLPSSEWLSSQLEESNQETIIKREKIKQVLKPVFDEFNLSIKEEIDGDLTPGSVEFIDTGSTGRGTNKPHDGDFDFLLRLDNDLLLDSNKKNKFMARLCEVIEKYHPEKSITIDKGDYRYKKIKLDDETTIDLDLSFVGKTNKVTYSSDMCVKDRLASIKKRYPEQYDLVVANIIQAKIFLKSQGVYKPYKSDATQGGLGGIGIENWVLQHGGSFLDATTSFVQASEGKDFAQFKKDYQIWDFGANHFADRKSSNSDELYQKIDAYPYDNFVAKNMSEAGYNKMRQALKQYLANYNHTYLNKQESIEETKGVTR